MKKLNIYNDNKSITVALDSLEIGETVEIKDEDAKRVRVAITNCYHLTGKGKFKTKMQVNEDGIKVTTVTKLGIGEIKQKRYPKVKTFIDDDNVAVLRVNNNTAIVSALSITKLSNGTLTNKLINDCKKFCNFYNLKLKL